MTSSSMQSALKVALFLAAAGALALAASQVRESRRQADLTVDDIENQLAALDPVTRSAVVARLTGDAVRAARAT